MDSETQSVVERARGGDREAFGLLVRKFGRAVYAAAYARLSDRDEAEDVAQECFVKAWGSISSLDQPGAFAGWLVRIAGNLAIDRGRKRAASPAGENGEESIPDPRPGPICNLEAEETASQVRTAVAELPEMHRTVVVMRFMEGMSYAEIEEALGITGGSLRGRLSRALSGLRRSLGHLTAAGKGRMQ